MKPTCSPFMPDRQKHVFSLAIVFLLVGSMRVPARAADDDAPGAQAQVARFQALRKERPNDGVLVFYEAIARLGLGQRETAFALLRSLKGRKLGLIPARGIGFDEVWDEPEFAAIRKELADEEPRTPDSPVAFRLSDPKLIPEGIAWDPKGERFFVGSVARRKILVADAKGKARDFSGPNDTLDDILGLTIDGEGAHLYAVSTNGFEESAKTERRNAVVRYDLKSGHLDRFAAPEAMQLNDVAVANDGTLYATDSASGTLFRKKPPEKTLSRFGQTGALPGANGITLAPDGTLYVTLSTGIARVDLTSAEPTRLPQPDSVVTGGIDGLYWHDGDLLGIQNTPNSGRVIRIALTDKGTRIAGLTVLQSHHHPKFDEPTTGAIANGALNVIGNSYVGHYQPDGTIRDAGELKGTAIVAVPLRR
jgi:sugar lactone lactonase YvrE